MRFPVTMSMLLIGATVFGCAAKRDTETPVALRGLPDRVLLKPGECTSTVSPDGRSGWICAQEQTAAVSDIDRLKEQLRTSERNFDQVFAEKVWLEQLLTSAQIDKKVLSDKLAAVTHEKNGEVAELQQQIELLDARVAALAAEKESRLSSDQDRDGVVDLDDLCTDTRDGLLVDQTGCARDQEIVPQGVNFTWNSTELAPKSHQVLNSVAEQLKRHPGLSFEIAGHTDNTGSAASNLTVSAQRADAVREYLVQRGIPAPLLSVRGYGMEKPIADNSTAEGRALNRRVSLYRPSEEVTVRN